MIKISRRSVIATGLFSALFSGTAFGRQQSANDRIYICESGVIDNPLEQRPFLCGVLSCTDVESVERLLNEKREQSGYRLEVSYNSTNRYKRELSKAMIDTVLSHEAVKIRIAVLSSKDNLGWPSVKAELASVYAEYQRQRMEKVISSSVAPSSIILERRSLGSRDDVLREHLEYEHGDKVQIEFVRAKESDLLQACDLVTGSIFGALERKVTNDVKKELIEYLFKQLGVDADSLSEGVQKEAFEVVFVDSIY